MNASNTRRLTRSLATTFAVAVLALAACADEPAGPSARQTPSFDRTSAPGQQRVAGLDAEYVRIARNAPGFGGMFYDANGKLTVYMTRESRQSARASQAILQHARASIQSRARFAPLARDISVLEGAYDYVQLATLRDRMSPVMGEPGVVFTDIDEANNRLRVGVLAGVSAAQVQAVVQALGIPAGAVSVEVTEPIVPLATLQSAQDPIGGGLQIWRFIPPGSASVCTLGFNARLIADNEQRYFFTNSHCTATRSAVDGTLFRQGPLSLATRIVAQEIADPPYFTCQYPGYQCRYSDAALAEYDSIFVVKLGLIYQTTGVNNGSLETLNAGKAFDISGERNFPTMGETLDKVGRTTGWTRGSVVATCVDTGVAGGPPTVMLCQDWVTAISAGGDSGSPIFQPTGIKNHATLYGILWGGTTTFSVFSAMDNIRAEFADFRTH